MQNTSPLMPAIAKVAAVSYCLGLWFFPLQWPPLPVVLISGSFLLLPLIVTLAPKQMAWNEISIWCGKTQMTRGPAGEPEFSKPDSNLSWLWPHNGGFWLSIPLINLTTVEEGRRSWLYSPPHFAFSLLPLEQQRFLQCSVRWVSVVPLPPWLRFETHSTPMRLTLFGGWLGSWWKTLHLMLKEFPKHFRSQIVTEKGR